MQPADRAAAQLATAAYQDVEEAEAAGYASTLDTLGCFQDPTIGGMGVHYLDDALMDATVDIAHPEALVYELADDGSITGLVAHEYIVPVDAWTATKPPTPVRRRLPPASHPAPVGPAHLDLEGQHHRRVR